MKVVVDNDILFKGACYGLLQEISAALKIETGECGVLGAARFVVRRKIKRAKLSQNSTLVAKRLEAFLTVAATLEPVGTEQALAARLEASALQLGLSLDAGESQLCAIVIERSVSRLVTGDKRAITALERLVSDDAELMKLCGTVVSLEQLVLLLMAQIHFDLIRDAICLESEADKTLTICFGCRSDNTSEPSARQGLDSYIRDLRSSASRVLAA